MKILSSLKQLFKAGSPEEKDYNVIRLESVGSTNDYLRAYTPVSSEERFTIVMADFQTSGRGQGTNTWESEAGKNLLFSVLCHPMRLPLRSQFMLSEAGALALKEAISKYIPEGIMLKWPNDVYYQDKKLSGTLIETRISGGHIKDFIFGVGLNVNQEKFTSNVPNPVSLCQILGKEVDREELLEEIIATFLKYFGLIEQGAYGDISALYHDALYQKKGFHTFKDNEGVFEGAIIEVEDDGRLVLRTRQGEIREYLFKEVEFVL